jgi:predicted phage-related endonuclease
VNFTLHTMPQRSAEWYAMRAGRVTGSRACDMVAKVQKGEAAARRDLRVQLVVERLTGQCQDDTFVNAAMQRGIDREADAFRAYEAMTGRIVRRTGFLAHNELMAGCSVDGDVDNFKGCVELKCPKSATHLLYLRTDKVPTSYLPQVQHALWISGAEWCDFVSFDDRFPRGLQVFCKRVLRKDVDLAAYELNLRCFLTEVDKELEAVRGLVPVAA